MLESNSNRRLVIVFNYPPEDVNQWGDFFYFNYLIMANHLVNFQHKLPTSKDWIQESEIIFISPEDNQKQGKEYKEFLLSFLQVDKKEIILFTSITRL